MLEPQALTVMLATLGSQAPRDRRESWEKRDSGASRERQATKDFRAPRATEELPVSMVHLVQLEIK